MFQEWVEDIDVISFCLGAAFIVGPSSGYGMLIKNKVFESKSIDIVFLDLTNTLWVKFGVSPIWVLFDQKLFFSAAIVLSLHFQELLQKHLGFIVSDVGGEWWECLSTLINLEMVAIEWINSNKGDFSCFICEMDNMLNLFSWCWSIWILSLCILSLHVAHRPHTNWLVYALASVIESVWLHNQEFVS